MGELKKHQPPMTIDEQVENLKSIGLIVNDEEYAKKILNDISYFRLVKAFSLNLKPKNGCYDRQTTFKEIKKINRELQAAHYCKLPPYHFSYLL